ncbi:TolC family protein [Parabacteroides sp. PF5-6]|uniref:TolC family protein n=1 Tax=Parabacteroides sp. PF5-6 TaxID=1742403 RepID=UPI002404D936|nr:TolC family protein [Parabacteroides sp. PF5-6]MDF9830046.1 outer membrane protein [Parabacteroides sp. PF5-6]
MRKRPLSPLRLVGLCLLILSLSVAGHSQRLLTIEQALDIAEENSPTLRDTRMNLERYQQNLIAQRASLKSRFSLNLTPINYRKDRQFENRLSQWYTNESFSTGGQFMVQQPILLTDGTISLINNLSWQDSQSSTGDMETSNRSFQNRLYLELSQPIFTYNTRRMALKEIEFAYENAYINYALQRLRTESQITEQFYRVYSGQSSLDIAHEELKNAQQSYDIIKDKVEADLTARDELFQAELNLATAKSNVESELTTLENAKDQLKKILGIPLDEMITVVTEVTLKEVEINLGQAIESGLSSRLELREREIEAEQLEFEMIRTKAQNEFKGEVNLSIGLTGDDSSLGQIYKKPTQSPQVMITFAVPIFDWGEKKARIKAQKIAQQIHEYQTRDAEIDIELEIRQAWRQLENYRTQISIAEQNVENAQLTYDLNLTRYREGDITGMEMNQFQTQLSNKRISYTQALINYKIQLLNMKILSLYDFEKREAIVPMEIKN